MSIAIVFGSTTGNTEFAAGMIRDEFGELVTLFADITDIKPADLRDHQVLILGCPTWHIGELQDDWELFLPEMSRLDLSGKKIAFFGMGDSVAYSDTFLDAFGEIWEEIKNLGNPKLIGVWSTQGYTFDDSRGLFDENHFLGLGLDEENQPELHEERVKNWVKQLRQELAI